MSKFVFCNIAHMKYYRGITEDDKPVNGGKYVNENGKAYECYNFFPVNHFCYGYFQHVGNTLNLERVEKVGNDSDILHDITVIWVANRKIVGWYEKADMFRDPQGFYEPEFDKEHEWWDYWFKVSEENVYLIPLEKRNFDIPSAPKLGKGMGMGQSNIWYADTAWAKEVFLPKVERYLDEMRGKYPIEYLTIAEINEKISPLNISEYDLHDEGCEMLESGQYLQALKIFNYLIYNARDSFSVCLAGFNRALTLEKLLLYDEAIETYKRALYEFNQLENEEKSLRIDLDCMWQLGRIYSVIEKKSLAYPMWEKLFEEEEDIDAKCDALIRMMWICQDEEDLKQLRHLLVTYDKFHTDKLKNEVQDLKKFLKDSLKRKKSTSIS